MTNKERYTKLLLSLSLLIGPAALISIGGYFAFSINAVALFLLIVGLQFLTNLLISKLIDSKRIEKSLSRYDSLKYKQYLIPLLCGSCGKSNSIEIDLNKTEFTCSCGKKNAIYINFSTAIATDPLYQPLYQNL